MGEAKRRHAQGQRFAAELARHLQAGGFGAAGAERYLIVLDKSPSGREALAALRASLGPAGLAALLAAEPCRLWEASALFEFIVLRSGSGTPEARSLLAAASERLLHEALPRACRELAGGGEPVGIVCGLGEPTCASVQAALRRLLPAEMLWCRAAKIRGSTPT